MNEIRCRITWSMFFYGILLWGCAVPPKTDTLPNRLNSALNPREVLQDLYIVHDAQRHQTAKEAKDLWNNLQFHQALDTDIANIEKIHQPLHQNIDSNAIQQASSLASSLSFPSLSRRKKDKDYPLKGVPYQAREILEKVSDYAGKSLRIELAVPTNKDQFIEELQKRHNLDERCREKAKSLLDKEDESFSSTVAALSFEQTVAQLCKSKDESDLEILFLIDLREDVMSHSRWGGKVVALEKQLGLAHEKQSLAKQALAEAKKVLKALDDIQQERDAEKTRLKNLRGILESIEALQPDDEKQEHAEAYATTRRILTAIDEYEDATTLLPGQQLMASYAKDMAETLKAKIDEEVRWLSTKRTRYLWAMSTVHEFAGEVKNITPKNSSWGVKCKEGICHDTPLSVLVEENAQRAYQELPTGAVTDPHSGLYQLRSILFDAQYVVAGEAILGWMPEWLQTKDGEEDWIHQRYMDRLALLEKRNIIATGLALVEAFYGGGLTEEDIANVVLLIEGGVIAGRQ